MGGNYVCSSRNAFNIASNERGHVNKQIGDYILLSSDGRSYINSKDVVDRDNMTNKHKVIITYAMSGGNKPGNDGKYQILSSLMVLPPNNDRFIWNFKENSLTLQS